MHKEKSVRYMYVPLTVITYFVQFGAAGSSIDVVTF